MCLYQRWVKRFLVYCRDEGLDDEEELCLSGVGRFAVAFSSRHLLDPRTSWQSARNALHAWRCALGSLGRLLPAWEEEKPATSPCADPLIHSFLSYRVRCRGIAEATRLAEARRIGDLLAWLRSRATELPCLSLTDLDRYVVALSERLAPKTVAGICSSIRAFLRFLHDRAVLGCDLSGSLAVPMIRSGDRPPRSLPWEDVQRILAAVDRSTSIGRRDYAMLLMMSVYGLGAGEVTGLDLGDVQWRGNRIAITRRKTGKSFVLPLLPAVALALSDYLRFGRPNRTESRALFVVAHAPHVALSGSSAIRHRIVVHAARAGVVADYLGSHVLRHSHATYQVELGTPVKIVGDILGHARAETTGIYVRSAVQGLRRISLPVPR